MKRWIWCFLVATVILTICMGSMTIACASDIDGSIDVRTLNIEAYLLGDNAIGQIVHVVRSSYVRSAPSQSSKILTDVNEDDKCEILDIYMESADPLAMWLKIDYFGMEGWVHAGCGKIVSGSADRYSSAEDPELAGIRSRYVGQTMQVNIKSGNARAGAGYEYPTIEYVRFPERYRILDCARDNEGQTWFMIRVSSRNCWIRTTLVDYIGD